MSICPSVGSFVGLSVRLSRVIFTRVLGASCAVYPALFESYPMAWKAPKSTRSCNCSRDRCRRSTPSSDENPLGLKMERNVGCEQGYCWINPDHLRSVGEIDLYLLAEKVRVAFLIDFM